MAMAISKYYLRENFLADKIQKKLNNYHLISLRNILTTFSALVTPLHWHFSANIIKINSLETELGPQVPSGALS
jgi:hypothetical protein